MYREKPSMDRELWKRSFYILIMFDIFDVLTLGRSFCINQEEWVVLIPGPAARADFDSYDLDLPLEVDDEYWEANPPAEAFKQPRDVPSMISSFNYCVRVGWIIGFIYRTLVSIRFKPNVYSNLSQYAIDKSASFVPKTRSRAEQILREIETALDEWLRSLPEHRTSYTFELVRN